MSAAAHGVTAFRGTSPAVRTAAPDQRMAARAARSGGGPVLPFGFARGVAFVALATFGALHWMAMLEPAAATRAWYAVGTGALAMLGLLAAARLRGALRALAAAGIALVATALAFLSGGVADELLRPDRWDALASGIGRGISALPGARVPYRGIDEWTRVVIPLGGTALTALAGLAAFWPRRTQPATPAGTRGRTGFPLVALILLVTLYAVPAVALDFSQEFLRGALLALLMLAFLRLERLRMLEAPAAAGLAVAAAIMALVVAPALDSDSPWWDYETWALSTSASRSTSFSWEHDYGPLDWPRDGREMLRVKAKAPAYWKAQSLDDFDGERWRQSNFGSREAIDFELPGDERNLTRWTQKVKVTVRNLRTRTFVTPGIPVDAPRMPSRAAIAAGPAGIWLASRTLRRGDSYTVEAYTPRPSERELAASGTTFERDLIAFRTLDVLEEAPAGTSAPPSIARVLFPEWDAIGVPVRAMRRSPGRPEREVNGERLMDGSELSRTWALSQRLKEGSSSPAQYVKAVETYLERGFTYTESPPQSASTLEGFLFDARSGYCQQYSGAMAMLLRMGGVPARVATGFTAGSFDRKTREYVVRDLDAHSWVEAWFPNIGWVTLDPTPAAAPPRSQGGERGTAAIGDAPDLGGAALDPRSGTAAQGGRPWGLYAGFAVLALALLAAIAWALRHGRGPTGLLELERALRRARRPAAPSATLQAIESSFAASPAAAAYVRALRELRYGGRGAPPTLAQRRGLRAELARGSGLSGRLRAWWALPPKRPGRRRTLDAHG